MVQKLKGRPPKYSDELIQQIYDTWDTSRYGYRGVAKELGISHEVVKYYIKKRRKIENAAEINQQHSTTET